MHSIDTAVLSHDTEPRSLLGLGVGSGMVFLLLLLTSLGVAAILIFTNGNFFASSALVAIVTAVIVTAYRIDYGFILFVGAVLIFDQFSIPGADPVTLKVAYFRNLKEIPYLPSFGAAVMNPVELHLFLLFFVWFVVASMNKQFRPTHVLFSWGAIVFFVGVLGFLVYGLQKGGEPLPALWEVRALFYLGIVYFFTPQVIRTREEVHALMWVCIGAIAFKALQGLARYIAFGFSTFGFPTLTNHEDPVFIVTLVVFLFALVIFNAETRQKWALLLLLLPMIMGFYVAQRRAAYAAIVPTFVAFVAALPRKERWVFVKTVFPVVTILALYVTIFWESESRLAGPVRLVKT
ncbi:MAG: hypothetical protein ACRDGA_00540, partial [Bacteroidota bacterium]